MTKLSRSRNTVPAAMLTGAALTLSLTGCAGVGTTTASAPVLQTLHLTGSMHGGQQPVSGANVYLYTVGGTANGSASVSLLTGAGTLTDTSGNGYVNTNAQGQFSITGDYTCPSGNTGVQTYLLGTGGNPGLAAGTSNSALTLMAALGPCSGLSASTFIAVNEVSTAAAVFSLQQFMVDATHVGASTNANITNQNALPNAFATVANLVDLPSGNALATPATGTGVSPQATLDTLGNIIAPCVNSAGPTSSACAGLFAAVTPSGQTAPTNAVGALLLIAQNPGYNVPTIYSQSTAAAPFQPALTTAPNDFTLAIAHTGGGLTYPGALAIDNVGNVFTTNCPTCNGQASGDSIVGFSAAGAVLTGAGGFTNSIHKPTSLAFDKYSGLWVTNLASGSTGNEVTKIDESGNVEYSPTFPVAFAGTPGGIAVDAGTDAWVSNNTGGTLVQIEYDGRILQTASPAGLVAPTGVAIDGLGFIYAAGTGSSNIVKIGNNGATFSPAGGYTGGGIASPLNLAIDQADNAWTVDGSATQAISEISAYDGSVPHASPFAGVTRASYVTIDGNGSAWIGNTRKTGTSTTPDNLLHLVIGGASATPSDGIQSSTLSGPTATAVDPSGNLWVSNSTGASLTEFVGVASPVVTEFQTAEGYNTLAGKNYLLNPGFEAAPPATATVGGNQIPGWSLAPGSTPAGTAYTESGNFAGANKYTNYNNVAYSTSLTQTMTVPNGSYLVTCFASGSSLSSTETAAMTVSGYGAAGATTSNPLTNLGGNFTSFTLTGIPVTTGTITLSLNRASTTGNSYIGWDNCSVNQQ